MIDKAKAISKLELMRCNSEWNKDFNKALDLAIKVLRRTDTDCISRQEAIEAIEGVDWYHVNSKGELVHGSTSDEESWYKAEDIYKAIESLPPVTPPRKVVAEIKVDTEELVKRIKEEYQLEQEHGRLIDADKLLQELFTIDEEEWTTPEIRAILENAPSVTSTKRTGRWIVDRYCSECERDKKDAELVCNIPTNYCPNCGAKMEGREE